MKKLLWVLILLLLPLTAWAEDAEIHRDGAFFYQIADGEAILTGCDWDAMQADSLYMFAEPPVSLEIPATLGGYPVTSIGGGVFCSLDGCPVDAPFEVVLPEGLRTLDAYTFTECFYATKITLPASLEIIPEGCFDRVPAEIDFPNGNPRYSCENGFLINNTTQTLLYTAPSSHGIALPAVRRLGDWSLSNYYLWYDDYDPVLPDTLESVGSYVFYDCGVTRVTFPDGITELSPFTFSCTALQEVHLPASLREIPDYCFWDCHLTALTIPDGVTRIGAHAVDWFTGEIIGAVTLPASVEFVGYRAFPDECDVTALNPQVHFETAAEYAERRSEYDWDSDEAADALYSDGLFDYELSSRGAVLLDCSRFLNQPEVPDVLEIPAELGGYPVTAIGGWVFCSLDGCPVDAPFEVVLPEGLRALDADTFADCFYAANVTLPASLEIIPEGCFGRIPAEIDFPNGNPRYSCENGFLIDNTTQTLLYTAPSSHGNPLPAVRRLGDCSLMNWLWDDDDDPVLPDTLESVGSYIFYDCGVTRVTFPDGITELSPYTFYCTDLQEVHLPASLREIPDYCFWNCQLIALTIPDGVTRIGAHAVDWFTGEIIGAVTLPASVEFVGYRAFPDECDVTALNPQVHFETAAEYAERIPEYDWYGDEAADALYSDGLFDYELSSRGAVLLDCSRFLNQPEVPDVLEIPSELGGTPVVAIAANALNTSESCADSLLFGIVLPEGVQRVEADAFQCCHAATQISFPSTLTMLAEGSFFHVYAEIDFPNGNPRYSCENGFLIDRDTQTLLYAAPSSQGQPIPAVRRLGDSALDNWKPAGNEIRLPDTLESIGPYALDGQYTGDFSPLAALILPDGVRELSDCSIYGCWEIQLLRFPATLTEIPAYCVANCGLGAVEIPEGVTRIGEFAFYYYDWEQTELSAVTLPASVEFVGFRAFPDECEITALNPDTHFETEEEINQRNPDWAYRIP
ncbi:MAG: leucine-rich repeat protein [Christensenellales bacterium]